MARSIMIQGTMSNAGKSLIAAGPVSYTHLDVYKRQAAFFPMLDMALTVYSKMDTFQDIKVKPYCHFEEDVLSESFCT